MAKAEIDARGLLRCVVVEVKIKHQREFNMRVWLALELIYLATWVLGAQLEIKEASKDDDDE